MREFFRVVTLGEAERILAENWPRDRAEVVVAPLAGALGATLAEDIYAQAHLPPFTRATVDGFAVRAADTFGASPALPAYLRIVGEVFMGQEPRLQVGTGEAASIPTGGVLPEGADAVVMVENMEEVSPVEVGVVKAVAPGENIIAAGEDVPQGGWVLARGRRLRPFDLGLLAGAGVTEVPVFPPLAVGILATGNEIIPPDRVPRAGQVRDMNSYTLLGLAQAAGARATLWGIAGDTLGELQAGIEAALAASDLLVLSGGSSVGSRDLVLEVLQERLGAEVLFHGVALKPGKPALAARVQDSLIIGVPGHPGAAAVFFQVLLGPLLARGEYPPRELQPTVKAVLRRSLASASGREEFVAVRLVLEDGIVWAEPVLGKSGLLRPLVQADGLLRIPIEKDGLAAGETVEITLLA
ncbi:MAG: molybdopterin molybdenumtransferase MoeA [Clostridia bacterium]|nr:MAG: molybdopterin molybdenumtransferase MoeA [Clostridia bacterium]